MSDRVENAAPIVAVLGICALIVAAIIALVVVLAIHVDKVERDCIKHNGKTYCEEMLQ